MKTSLQTNRQQGYLDFLSGIICFSSREEKDKSFIESSFLGFENITPDQAEIRSLLVHEVTHLMDLLTTIWGLEYVVRKNRAYMAMEGAGFEEKLSVFMLSTAEIESHDGLKKTYSEVSLNEASVINHALIYDDKYGPLVIVNYVANDQCIHQTPLSMLSLLEAHATSEEMLSRINDARLSENPFIELELIKSDFKRLLGNVELSEYSLLLYLTELHFKDFLTLEQILRLVSALSRVSLDLSSVSCSSFGVFIKDTFQNKVIGYDICMDLCRGMSRQIVFFKTVLLMHDWLKKCSGAERDMLVESLKINPANAIINFFEINGVYYNAVINDLEFNFCLESIPGDSPIPDKKYANEIADVNRKLLRDSCLADHFSSIYMPQILLDDDTEVFPAKVVAAGHMCFVKENVGIYARLDSMYKNNEHRKFHPAVGTGLEFFDQALNFSNGMGQTRLIQYFSK